MSRDRHIHEQVTIAVCRVLGTGIASVGIQVEDSIVQVSGVVDTPEERTAVERAVWSVPDVRAITRRLRVRRTFANGPTDRRLASDVLALLVHEGESARRVLVEEGIVTILGTFASPITQAAIGAAVATVSGVRGVFMDEAWEDRAGAATTKPSPLSSRIRFSWH
jgi:osmotically-inducible protein OsmY